MKTTAHIQDLKNEFCSARLIELSSEEFCTLLILFPSYKVAIADGIFSASEKDLMEVITANFLKEIYANEISNDQYNQLISGTIDDLVYADKNSWHDRFERGLKELSNQHEGLAEEIKKMIHDMAEASDGISESEQNMINQINESL